MELRPYQSDGVEFLRANSRAFLLDEPGLGKTVQAISAAREEEVEKVCVVCPAIACTMWRKRWREWWPGGPEPEVASYNRMSLRKEWRDKIQKWRPEILIADEAHYLKTFDSQRTQLFYGFRREAGLVSCAWRVWLLSGTPTPNWPDEWFSHLRGLFPKELPQPIQFQQRTGAAYEAFRDRYCYIDESRYGRRILGARSDTAAELADILKPYSLRRTVREVLPDLPALEWQDLPLDALEAGEILTQIREEPTVQEMLREIERSEDAVFRAPLSHLASVRRVIGKLKAPIVASLVEEELRLGAYRQVVLFAYHREVIDILMRALYAWSVSLVTGSTTPHQRDKEIEAFQNGENLVFVAQIDACGTAIDLTAAHHCILVEPSWVPETNVQAVKRLHRIGQPSCVIARMASLSDSLDEVIAEVLLRKQVAITKTLKELE